MTFMPALQTLIRETRDDVERRWLTQAYQLVALVRKEVSEDEGIGGIAVTVCVCCVCVMLFLEWDPVGEKEKRRAAVEERASRMLEKDFFKGTHFNDFIFCCVASSIRELIPAILLLCAEYNPKVELRRLPNGYIPKVCTLFPCFVVSSRPVIVIVCGVCVCHAGVIHQTVQR